MASEKTKGIVLHALKYSDTSAVVTIYTERFGRAAYMVYGVGGKRAVCRPALLQPLSLVELEVVHRPGKDLQRIREMRMAYPLEDLPFNPVKNSIALFLSEVLYRVLRRSEADGDLYAFLERSVLALDGGKGRMSDFQFITCCDKFRAIPKACSRLYSHAINCSCNNKHQPSCQVVDCLVLFHAENGYDFNYIGRKDSKYRHVKPIFPPKTDNYFKQLNTLWH